MDADTAREKLRLIKAICADVIPAISGLEYENIRLREVVQEMEQIAWSGYPNGEDWECDCRLCTFVRDAQSRLAAEQGERWAER